MQSIGVNVTVVSEDARLLQEISWSLTAAGYRVQTSRRFEPLVGTWQAAPPDFLLVDYDHSDVASASRLSHLGDDSFTCKILLCNATQALDRVAELELSFNDVLTKPVNDGELLARLRAGARFLEFERSLREQSLCDHCTGLLSRNGLLQTLELSQQTAVKEVPAAFGLVLLSFDYLVNLTRRLGVEVRDQLLCDAADMLEASVGEQAWLARIGPNAFALAFANCAIDQLEKVAEEVRHNAAHREFDVRGNPLRMTATVCVLSWDGSTMSPEDALAEAERNLLLAESLGGSTASWCGQFDEIRAAWEQRQTEKTAQATATARDVMTPFAAVLRGTESQDAYLAAVRASDVKIAAYYDEQGHYAGIVRDHGWQDDAEAGVDQFVETPPQVSDRAACTELVEQFADQQDQLVVVMCDRRPIGYIASDDLAEIFPSD